MTRAEHRNTLTPAELEKLERARIAKANARAKQTPEQRIEADCRGYASFLRKHGYTVLAPKAGEQ